jgi:hypothetical protein
MPVVWPVTVPFIVEETAPFTGEVNTDDFARSRAWGKRTGPMTDRRLFRAVALPRFLIGVVCGVGIRMSNGAPELWEIDPDFRRNEVDEMFADFRAGRIQYTVELPVLDGRLKVQMVSDLRGADYGLVPLSDVGDVPDHFWYYKVHEFDIKKYDDNTLFVTIKDRYGRTLDKTPGAPSVAPKSKAKGQ